MFWTADNLTSGRISERAKEQTETELVLKFPALAVVHSLVSWFEQLKVSGSVEQWCIVSRCSRLMVVSVEGHRQCRGFSHWVFEVFSLVSWFEQLKVAGSVEQWCMVFEVVTFDVSSN